MALKLSHQSTCLILFSLFLPFAQSGAGYAQVPVTAKSIDQVLASIDGSLITRGDLRFWLFQARTNYPELRSLPDDQLISMVLKEAVEEELLWQTFWADEITPSDEEVKEFLEISYQDMVEQYESENRLKEELRTWKLDSGEFRRWLEERVRRDWVIQTAIAQQVPLEDQREAEERASKEEDQVRLREIFIEVRSSAKGSEPGVEDWRRVEYLMNSIRIDISEGMSFTDAAKIHSQSPAGSDGGDLGWIKESDLLPAISNAISLLRVGQTTPPVRLSSGIALYKLDNKQTSLSLVQRELRQSIRQRALQESMAGAGVEIHPDYPFLRPDGSS